MAAIVGGLCMESLWRGWRFRYDRHEEITRYVWIRHMYYHPMVMRVFCLPLKFFGCFVIPDAIVYNLILNMFQKTYILISSS